MIFFKSICLSGANVARERVVSDRQTDRWAEFVIYYQDVELILFSNWPSRIDTLVNLK